MKKKTYEVVDGVEKLEAALERVRAAQKIYAGFTQEQVDKIFLAAASAANKAVMRLNFIFIILYLLITIFKVHISPLLFIIFYTAFGKMTLPRWVNYAIHLDTALHFLRLRSSSSVIVRFSARKHNLRFSPTSCRQNTG